METKNSEGLRAPKWVSVEQYSKQKIEFKESNKVKAREIIRTSGFNRYMKRLTANEEEIGSDLLLDFMWGLQGVSNASGYGGEIPELLIEPLDCLAITSIRPDGSVVFKINYFDFVSAIQSKENKSTFEPYYGSYLDEIDASTFFEIVGVEEMAHILFIETKGVPQSKNTGEELSYLDYHSQDIEERSLFWKTAYAKRYLPMVYEQNQKMLRKVLINRTKEGKIVSDRRAVYENGYIYDNPEEEIEEEIRNHE